MTSTKASVLIVEDEGIVARDLQETLTEFGYDARAVATNAADALASAAQSHPDVVLMDVRIAGAQDGIHTAATLRSRFNIPVIFLTAHVDEDTLVRASLTNPAGYLVKPVEPQELRTAIESALRGRSETGQAKFPPS